MKRGTCTHRKIVRLGHQLGVPRLHAAGIWAQILEYVAEHATNGDVTDHTDMLASVCDWPDEKALILALVAVKSIDEVDGKLILHGWSEHAEDSVHMRLANRGERFADGSLPRTNRLNATQRARAEERLGVTHATEARKGARLPQPTTERARVPSPSPKPSPKPSPPPSTSPSASPLPSDVAAPCTPPAAPAGGLAGPEGESAAHQQTAGVAGLADHPSPGDPVDRTWLARRLVEAKAAICNSPIAPANRGKAAFALATIAKSGRDPLGILDDISSRATQADNPGGYLLRSLEAEALAGAESSAALNGAHP